MQDAPEGWKMIVVEAKATSLWCDTRWCSCLYQLSVGLVCSACPTISVSMDAYTISSVDVLRICTNTPMDRGYTLQKLEERSLLWNCEIQTFSDTAWLGRESNGPWACMFRIRKKNRLKSALNSWDSTSGLKTSHRSWPNASQEYWPSQKRHFMHIPSFNQKGTFFAIHLDLIHNTTSEPIAAVSWK